MFGLPESSIAAQVPRLEAVIGLEVHSMVDTETEIQKQLEAANARLKRRREELGIRDDRPVHAGAVAIAVLTDMVSEAEEANR